MSHDDLSEKPDVSAGDVAHTITKAGLSAIPVIGGPAAELFSAIIVPPLTKRRDDWVSSIASGLRELEEKLEDFDISKLSENQEFVTVTMQATQIAIRNHQEEKLEALRAAVLNTAIGRTPEEDIQTMFLNFIDTLTVWHIRILKFFQNPVEWGEKHGIKYPTWSMGGPGTVLEHAFAELKGKRDIYDQMVTDLYNRGLLGIDSLHTIMSATGMFASRTTSLGNQFIDYITPPSDTH